MNAHEQNLASAMRQLRGQIATPSWLADKARELEARGLMKFHKWPSGHWQITDRGREFLWSLSEQE